MHPLASTLTAVALLVTASPALATEDPGEVLGGVYVGHRVGSDQRVTVELRGASVIVLDDGGVAVGRSEGWALAGPGGKGGELRFRGEVTALTYSSRAGKAKANGKKSLARFELAAERGEASLCMTAPGSKTPPPTRVPARGATGTDPGVTCFELTRVWRPGDVDAACVSACVARNQMKAVSIEQIEADCKAECVR